MIVVVGLSHKTAPIQVRERLAISKDAVADVLARLLAEPAIGEALVLSTCNRVEVYAAPRRRASSGNEPSNEGDLEAAARAVVRVLVSVGGEAVSAHLLRKQGKEAVRHLFRVAASLDSLVLGEPQILGQLKEAIEIARARKALGMTLGRAVSRAVRVGKRVRTETALGAGQVSISSVAVELAQQIFDALAGRVTLLIGAGEMAEAASKLLARAGAKLVVVNRNVERAKALARDLGEGARSAEARGFSDLERSLVEADIVIASTSSPTYVVTPSLVKAAFRGRRGRSLFFIDIAVPRDVDPAVNKLDNVFLYDIDDLSQIVAESRESRAAEAARAESIVAEEEGGFEAWTVERALTPTIVGLRTKTRAMLAAEMERSLSGKLRHLRPEEREALSIMLDAATNRLLHGPVTRLRHLATDPRADDYVDAIRHLFDLSEASADEGEGRPSPSPSIEPPKPARSAEPGPSKDPPAGRAGNSGQPAADERANV